MSLRRIEGIKDGPFRHGVISNMPREEYREACGLNPSSLKKPSPRVTSPKHIKYAYENNGESTDAMKLGTATHVLCWEPHRFTEDVAVWESRRAGKAWEEFLEENDGKTIITAKQFESATAIANALCADPQVKRLASHGIAETALFTEEHGMQCRGLMDWLNTDLAILCDLKVVASIDERMFGNAVQRYGWDVSMACYKRWFEREANKEIRDVKFIAVESAPPHDIAVVSVDEAVLEAGWAKAEKAIKSVRGAIDSGEWPGMYPEETPLFVPSYAMDEELVEFTEEAA